MKYLLTLLSLVYLTTQAQENRILTDDIRSLRTTAYDDPLLPPIVEQRKPWQILIDFDQLSHDYHRYIYHIDLCNADWTKNEEVFESDYLSGLNDQPIEDFEKSFNTTQIYTHYALTLPSDQTRLLLAGNYRVSIYDEDNDEQPVATAEFCIADPRLNITATLTGNTDTDINGAHQQLGFAMSYGGITIADPTRELHTVVVQNRRQDMRIVNPRPTYLKSNALEYVHHRDLIFPAGNEYRKFEILDIQKPGMNIDHIRWYEPYHYATLFEDTPMCNYVYDEDQNGASWIRNEDDEDNATTCEYLWVNFTLKAPRQPHPVYVCGSWTNSTYDPECLMTYNEQEGCYEASIYLKQGYYNYQYRTLTGKTVTDERGNTIPQGTTQALDGNFYETDNEYIILVYHRPPTARTDKLVGYKVVRSQ